jgi:pre-mRNA-processing factor SLU7
MSRSAPPKPPAEDTSRNEYIPAFISKAPFWAEQSDSDYLEHQRNFSAPKDTLDKAKWYDRGKKLGPAATKYRKGACQNCGAMTHKTKECLSRPRKTGAKWSGRDIQADEVVDSVQLGWDAKRDRWNGYDAREYDQVVKDYEELETLQKDVNGNGDSEDAKYAEETDMGRNQSTSTRQLRLREDTAGFLLDLTGSTESYNPKTRTLDTGTKQITDTNGSDLASEGFMRPAQGKDAEAFQRAQRYAWETQEDPDLPSELKVHLQANPTAGALLMKKHEEEVAAKKASQKAYLLDKYGNSASLTTQNKPAATITASESYVEYDDSGAIKGQPVTIPKSKYPEDVYPNNHTSVFGSYWSNFRWGYTCCGSFVKNSYCTGEEGRKAFEEEAAMRTGRKLITEGGEEGADANGGVNSHGEGGKHEFADRQRKRPPEGDDEGSYKRSKLDEDAQ